MVIAIIAILAAMLLPVLTKARGQAHNAVCVNNQRQLFLAFQFYASDHDDGLPWRYNAIADQHAYIDTTKYDNLGYGAYNWGMMIYPYVGTIESYRCPACKPEQANPKYGLHPDTGWPYMRFYQQRATPYLGWPNGWYGFNGDGFSGGKVDWWADAGLPGGNDYSFSPAKLDRIRTPDGKVLLHCGSKYTWFPYGTSPYMGAQRFTGGSGSPRYPYELYNPWYERPRIGVWHNLKTNFTFVDGHREIHPWDSSVSFGPSSATLAEIRVNDDTYWKLYH